MTDKSHRQRQIEIAQRLQLKWLEEMDRLIDSGEMTPTDRATLARVLSQNGWSLDPTLLPTSLKDKLTAKVSFDDDDDEPRLRAMP